MPQFNLVDTQRQLRANVSKFTKEIATLAGRTTKEGTALANGCSHAVEWVAFPDGSGGYEAAFSKYVGYDGVTPLLYDQYRKSDMTGTDTKRRVEKFGGTVYPVGRDAGAPSHHAAVLKVREICALMGKTPKLTSKVRVFNDADRPATMDVLVAAIRAAELTADELTGLFDEVRIAA